MKQPLYIHFRFKNAAIKRSYKARKGQGEWDELQKLIDTDSIAHPVKANQISGFLHVLCGCAPVPSKRLTVLSRVDEIQELVDNTWIRYDRILKLSEREYTSVAKAAYNSHKTIKMKIGDKVKDGYYTWDYLHRHFIGNPSFHKKLIEFFNKIMGFNVYQMEMKDFIPEFHKHIEEPEVWEFHHENVKLLRKPFFDLIFNIPNTNSNTKYNFKETALLNSNGTGFAFYYSGDIIVRIDNEILVQQIREIGTIPHLLDGGTVDIIWTGNEEPYPLDSGEFERFSSKDCSLTH